MLSIISGRRALHRLADAEPVRYAPGRLRVEAQGRHVLWVLLLALAVTDAVWMLAGKWSLRPASALWSLAAFAAFATPLAWARYRDDARIGNTLRACAFLLPFSAVSSTLSYLVVSSSLSLVDPALAAADRAIGFDWIAMHAWMQAHPAFHALLQLAYASGMLQIAFVIIFLGFSARIERLNEFVELFVATTLLAIVVSLPFPAAGPWTHYQLAGLVDTSAMSHFALLRDGSLRTIDLREMQGLISLPSMHTALAVLLTYALRGTRLLWPFGLLNALMILATPIEGGHYLVDVPAGAAVAALLIFARRAFAWQR